MMLPVTAFFAGVLALWLMLLTWQVAKLRRTKRILLGDDGHGDAQRLIRGHGNAAETIPIFLILLGLGEGLGAPVWVVGALGVTFTAGRILHGLHFMWHRTDLSMRFSGMVLTLFSTTLAALGVMAHALAELF